MNIFQAIILACVEGITEFLPVSSTGHLILAANLLEITQTDFVKSFEIIIQLGAILAVIVLYWKSYLQSLKVWRKILFAFIPTGIFGFIFYSFVKDVLIGNTAVTLWALFLGGLSIILLEKFPLEKESHKEKIEEMSDRQAIGIGIFQIVSMIPGVSRSAASIIGGLCVGLKRKAAVEFSFLLAIPTITAATFYDVARSEFSFNLNELGILAVGFVCSFIVAFLAIRFFISLIKMHTLTPFGVYRILLAVLYFFFIV